MKLSVIVLCTVIFITDAVEVTDQDINSPLVSYLLAKVQRMEAKMMVRPNMYQEHQTDYRQAYYSTSCCDNKQCNCPPSVVTYIRWSNSTCPYGADTIYSEVVAGSGYGHQGAAVDPLCLPPDPQYYSFYQAGYQENRLLYAAEYQLHSSSPINLADDRNVPCALCQVYGHTNKIMIPSHYECPSGWRREYYGYLMAGHYTPKAATQFTCVDKSLELIPGSRAFSGGYLLNTVEAYCNQHIPCSDKELSCVVCTK